VSARAHPSQPFAIDSATPIDGDAFSSNNRGASRWRTSALETESV
jgi:hypothetical protein